MEEKVMNDGIMEVAEEAVSTGGSGIGGKLGKAAIAAAVIYGGYKLAKKFIPKKKTEVYAEIETTEDEEGVIDAEMVEELNKKMN